MLRGTGGWSSGAAGGEVSLPGVPEAEARSKFRFTTVCVALRGGLGPVASDLSPVCVVKLPGMPSWWWGLVPGGGSRAPPAVGASNLTSSRDSAGARAAGRGGGSLGG